MLYSRFLLEKQLKKNSIQLLIFSRQNVENADLCGFSEAIFNLCCAFAVKAGEFAANGLTSSL
jgi:hypothetical protein